QAGQPGERYTDALRRFHIERAGHTWGAQHEARPRHAPIENVGLAQSQQRPAFQMLAPDPAVERDSMPGCAHPDAQLYVFNRRPPVSFFVKASKGQEQVAPDGAAPAPESGNGAVRSVMNIVMKEILVLREEILFGRGIVVRADNGVDLRVRSESCGKTRERVRMDEHIRVNKDQVTAIDLRRASIARARRAPRPVNPQIFKPETRHQGFNLLL